MSIPAADLADLLLRVARRIRAASWVELDGATLSPHQARALRSIGRHGPLRPSVLAERLHIAPRSATEVVEHLVASGWVSRERDPDDGRAWVLSLTPAGGEMLAVVDAARARGARSVLGHLTDAERAALAAALAPLAEAPPDRGDLPSPGAGEPAPG